MPLYFRFNELENKNAQWCIPVSYTHLDVYKRQDQDIEPDIRALLKKTGEERRQQVDQQGVVGGDAQFPGRLDLLPGELAGEGGDVVVDAGGELDHLLAGRRRDIAAAMALEQAGAERLLDLTEAAEHRRVIDAERCRGCRQRPLCLLYTSRCV